MALLQSDKAVFYHPLDDSTESLQSQAWTLGSGSLVGAGKISLALSGTTASILSFGTEHEFLSVGAAVGLDMSVSVLSATKIVVTYTYGAAKNFSGFGSDQYSAPLSSTAFVVVSTKVAFVGWLKNPSA